MWDTKDMRGTQVTTHGECRGYVGHKDRDVKDRGLEGHGMWTQAQRTGDAEDTGT